jgi:hypothetical protein
MTQIKTVLAPNAPWPKQEKEPTPQAKGWRKRGKNIKYSLELDYFAEAREQIQSIKSAKKPRARDITTGRFKGDNRLSG